MPGHENVISIKSAPPINEDTVNPVIVNIGSRVFGKACFTNILESFIPLLLAASI